MTKRDIVKNNLSLSFDFIQKIVGEPDLLQQIPDGAEIEFVKSNTTSTKNKSLGTARKKKYVRVKNDFEII